MKQLKIGLLIFIYSSYLCADTHSLTINNDAIFKKDAHYTNGFFYTWMSDATPNFMDNLKTNSAISFTHLIFTPENTKTSKPQLDDTPYAGYANLNFLLYKSAPNYFHEFGINIGMIGSKTKAKQIQSNFHHLIGSNTAKGWDNQLKDKVIVGASYHFGHRSNQINMGLFKFDWFYNLRVDLGNAYSGALIGTTLRIGSNLPNNFITTGNFIGGEESHLLNFHNMKKLNWAISLGFFANRVNNFYLFETFKYMTGEVLSYNIYHKNFQYSFQVKSIYLVNNKILSQSSKKWGGVTIIWKF